MLIHATGSSSHADGSRASPAEVVRPRVHGKFFFRGEEKLWVRGVTYGTFRPDDNGQQYNDPTVVERDFAAMTANGFNAVRTYTVPPRWILDCAARHGLRVMICLPWEQHVTFLDDHARARSIERRVAAGVRACAGHPAVLCYAVGNEIPAPIVRWHGRRAVERFIKRLWEAVKTEDADGLVTYVNYPSTEYLELPFLDFACANVYLEFQNQLRAYLARLQNLAGDRPLVMGEIGLDSRRHGELAQARVLEWQLRAVFAEGCAGAFVFSWTDEWHRGGHNVEDWDFGLTTRERRPKPALAAVRRVLSEVPFPENNRWPRISVVVCSYNGARTIARCLDGLLKLEYPDYEVIVVDDGSTDDTRAIAEKYGFRIISTPNHGLSHARNLGLKAASGEIVAYIDDDAWPDPHWLTYLATTFMTTDHVGVGGPNVAPASDPPLAHCVANAPGGPVHVLLSDREAEHIPGCNMAFRKSTLEAIGGFDTRFRTAGDDVDVCWRLQERGLTLGFNPTAFVWHHRRGSVGAYWRQQVGYGRAEALLERKWPGKYNGAGHVKWEGRLYGKGLTQALRLRAGRVYRGRWGCAPFQAVYDSAPGVLASLPLMPEWYLVVLALGVLGALGTLWTPLLMTVPLLALAMAAPIGQAIASALPASFPGVRSRLKRLELHALTAVLHLIQPAARLYGRLKHGLTPWRQRAARPFMFPVPRQATLWSETWRAPASVVAAVEERLRSQGARVAPGGDFDRWDLQVRHGLLGAARVLMTVEEHGAGRQLFRFRTWPRPSAFGAGLVIAFGALAAAAILDDGAAVAPVLAGIAAGLAVWIIADCGLAMATVEHAVHEPEGGKEFESAKKWTA